MDRARTTLTLRVVPGSRRPGIVGRHGAAWKIRVSAPAENGRANDAVLDLLARALHVPRRDVRVTRGVASRDKVVLLEGLTGEAVDARLTEAVEAPR